MAYSADKGKLDATGTGANDADTAKTDRPEDALLELFPTFEELRNRLDRNDAAFGARHVGSDQG